MMISNKRGFTLIELLVVVLIIGVLAAVALPQYQTAINKSRYAGLMPLAKSVKDAEEEVFMTKADYTAVLEDLSVMAGSIDENHANKATKGNVELEVVAGAGEGQDYVRTIDSRNPDNAFVMYFARSPKFPGEIHCEATKDNKRAEQLCKSYGPIAEEETGTEGTFKAYVLQGAEDRSAAQGGGNGGGGSVWNCENLNCTRETITGNEISCNGYYDDEDGYSYSCISQNSGTTILAWSCEGELSSDGGCEEFYHITNSNSHIVIPTSDNRLFHASDISCNAINFETGECGEYSIREAYEGDDEQGSAFASRSCDSSSYITSCEGYSEWSDIGGDWDIFGGLPS